LRNITWALTLALQRGRESTSVLCHKRVYTIEPCQASFGIAPMPCPA